MLRKGVGVREKNRMPVDSWLPLATSTPNNISVKRGHNHVQQGTYQNWMIKTALDSPRPIINHFVTKPSATYKIIYSDEDSDSEQISNETKKRRILIKHRPCQKQALNDKNTERKNISKSVELIEIGKENNVLHKRELKKAGSVIQEIQSSNDSIVDKILGSYHELFSEEKEKEHMDSLDLTEVEIEDDSYDSQKSVNKSQGKQGNQYPQINKKIHSKTISKSITEITKHDNNSSQTVKSCRTKTREIRNIKRTTEVNSKIQSYRPGGIHKEISSHIKVVNEVTKTKISNETLNLKSNICQSDGSVKGKPAAIRLPNSTRSRCAPKEFWLPKSKDSMGKDDINVLGIGLKTTPTDPELFASSSNKCGSSSSFPKKARFQNSKRTSEKQTCIQMEKVSDEIFVSSQEARFIENKAGFQSATCWSSRNKKCGVLQLQPTGSSGGDTKKSTFGGVVMRGCVEMCVGGGEPKILMVEDMVCIPPDTCWRMSNPGLTEARLYFWCIKLTP